LYLYVWKRVQISKWSFTIKNTINSSDSAFVTLHDPRGYEAWSWIVFGYFWVEHVVGIFGLRIEGRCLDLGLSWMKIWEVSLTLDLKKQKYALLLDGQECSSWILRELFFLAECWQGFLLLTLDPFLFSKGSLFRDTSRLLHLKFPSQPLMGFDLIFELKFEFGLPFN
jgi:hypothetical protein